MTEAQVRAVLEAVGKLHYREKRALMMKYGIEANQVESPERRARFFGISVERLEITENQAIKIVAQKASQHA